MPNKKIKIIFLILILLTFSIVGYDLAQLQSGLEMPPDEVLNEASKKVDIGRTYKSITAYDSFLVPVEDDISVRVYTRENQDAIANILMVHGAGSGPYAWEIYFDLFPEKYNLYALSWRGHQGSTPVKDANTQDFVMDQKAVIDSILKRNSLPIHIIGHSYGGATSIMLAEQSEMKFKSFHLIAPIVPLEYSTIQELLVPIIAPYFIKKSEGAGNDPFGTYGEMFISKERMLYYYEKYAKQDFSIEKPSVIAGDGVSADWQTQLDNSYTKVGSENNPIWMFIARYDNVVVPERQRKMAKRIGAEIIEFESGHYIPLDAQAEESAKVILNNLAAVDVVNYIN